MSLSKNEIAIIQNIQERIKYGDMAAIAKETGATRSYVGKVLNVTTSYYNEKIIEAAIKIITAREQQAKQNLKALTAA